MNEFDVTVDMFTPRILWIFPQRAHKQKIMLMAMAVYASREGSRSVEMSVEDLMTLGGISIGATTVRRALKRAIETGVIEASNPNPRRDEKCYYTFAPFKRLLGIGYQHFNEATGEDLATFRKGIVKGVVADLEGDLYDFPSSEDRLVDEWAIVLDTVARIGQLIEVVYDVDLSERGKHEPQ